MASNAKGTRRKWLAAADEPDHQLTSLNGREFVGGRLRVMLGPTSRFGARYFRILLEAADGTVSGDAVLTGLHNSGPLPSYNWVEVAETNERVSLANGTIEIGRAGIGELFRLLFELLPPGGHLMVEYDSAARAETAAGLAHRVPAIATPLGELLFRIGFGARFKDWQIAEGGAEGPRKLQAYKPPAGEHASRWRREAVSELHAFLRMDTSGSDSVAAARDRAEKLLAQLAAGEES